MSEAKILISAEDRTKAILAGVKANLGQVHEQAGRLNAGFGALGVVMGSAFAGLSFTAFIKSTAAGIDRLNDLKDATGASIENISALEDTALRTGTSIETVETSLIKLNSVLKDASPGSTQAKVLAAIGLNAEELKRIDPAQALLKTASALNGFADDGNKARYSQELLGKSLREVAPFMKDLAEKGELVAKMTTQQAEEAEKFNKQLAELGKNSTDTARRLVNELLPALNNVFESYRKYGGLGGAILARLGLDDLSKLEAKATAASDAVKRAADTVDRLSEASNRSPGDQFLATRLKKAEERLKSLTLQAQAASDAIKSAVGVPAEYSNEGRNRPKPSAPDISKITAKPDSEALREQRRLDDIIKRITEKNEVSKAELGIGRQLTEMEKFRIDVLADLARLKVSPEDLKRARAKLDEATATAKLREEQAELLRVLAASGAISQRMDAAREQRVQGLADEVLNQRQANEEIGLNTRRIEALRIKRLEGIVAREEEDLSMARNAEASAVEVQGREQIIALLRQEIVARREAAAKRDAISKDPTLGARTAIEDYLETVERSGDATRDAFANSLKGAEDALTSFFQTGKLDAAKFADSVIAEILRISLVRPLIGQAASFIGSFLGLSGFAKGGAFMSSGQLTAFASGGVFNEPTYFKYGGGKHAGVLGEAGPEAIMPLARGAGGELGIINHGGSQPQVTNNNFYQVGSNISRAEVMGALQLLADTINTRTDAKLARAGIR